MNVLYLFHLNYVGFKFTFSFTYIITVQSSIWTMWDLNIWFEFFNEINNIVPSELCGI